MAYRRKRKLEIFLGKFISLINWVITSRRLDRNCFSNREPFFVLNGKKDAQPFDSLDELERYSAEPRLLELCSIVFWWMDPAQ